MTAGALGRRERPRAADGVEAMGLTSGLIIASALFTMSISTGLVLPLMLPHPSYIAFLLLTTALLVCAASGRRVRYESSKVLWCLGGVLAVFSLYGFQQKVGTGSITAYLQSPALLILLMAVLLSATRADLTRLIRIYIVFCFAMALPGLLAWVLVNWQIVDYRDFQWSLFEATAGRAPRDEGFGWGSTNYGYSFPYGLGLILTGSYKYDVFGFAFYRASGWVHEPTTATAFIAPALILLARDNLFSRRVRVVFFVTLVAFWTACAAVGSLVAFLGLIAFYLVISRGRYPVLRRLTAVALIGAMYWIYRQAQTLFATVSEYTSLLGSKLDENADVGRIFTLLAPKTGQDVAFLILFLLMVGMTLLFAVRTLRSKNREAITFALILVYFVLHSLKGDWGHLFASFFVMAFIFFYLRIHLSRWSVTGHSGTPAGATGLR